MIWVLSNSENVNLATKVKNWEIIDLHKGIEVFDGIEFNLGQFQKEEGSPFA